MRIESDELVYWCVDECRNPMYLAEFEFLLAANAHSVQATASGGVLAKTSSCFPYAACCATNLAFTALFFMSCSLLYRTFVRDLTSLSHATSNTLWSSEFLSSLTRAFTTAPWHIGSPDLVAYTCFRRDESFLRRWSEWHSLDVFRHVSAVFLIFQQVSRFIEPFVVNVIQHAHFLSTSCPGTLAHTAIILHLAVFGFAKRSLVRRWQLYFHVCGNRRFWSRVHGNLV